MKITNALDLFLLDCQSRRLTKSTVSFYKDKVRRFAHWLADNGVTALDSITAVMIKRYLVSLQDRGLTSGGAWNAGTLTDLWMLLKL